VSASDKYKAILEGTYNDPSTPEGRYNFSFSQQAERDVGESLADMIPEDEDSWDMQDTTMTARMFVDGLWMNKAEEVGSWIAAGAYKLFGGQGSEEKSVTQIRNEMLGMLEAESARFQEERPGVALTSNVAGSILSPASLAGGQLLARAQDVRRAGQASLASQEVSSMLGARSLASVGAVSDEGARLAQQLSGFSPRAYAIAQRTPTPVLGAGLAAAESAVIGAEGETVEERILNAGKSAALGATFSGALSTIGFGVNKALQSNVAQQLGQGKDFVSLMFTDHALAPVYRNVVAKAFGAKSFMEQQARNVSSRIRSVDELKERGVNLVENAKKRLQQSARIIGAEKDQAIEEAKILADDLKDDLTARNTIDIVDLDDVSRSRIAGLEDARDLNIDNIKANAAKEADEAVNALEASFRAKVYKSSLPSAAPKYLYDDIQTLTPQQAKETIDETWVKFGFQRAKNSNIAVSATAISRNIEAIIESTPSRSILDGQAGFNLAGRVASYVDEVLSQALGGAKSGVVSGQTLVDMRSSIGRLINNISEDKFTVKEVLDPIQDYIDDLILKRLRSGKARDEFIRDRDLWRIKSTIDDAAYNAVKKKSAFSADDWIRANAKQSKRMAVRGKGIFQKEAEEIRDLAKQRDEQIKLVAKKTSDNIMKDAKKAINEEKLRLSNLKKQAASDLAKARKEVTARYNASAKSASDKAELDLRIEEFKSQYKIRIADIDSQIKKIQDSQKIINEIVPSKEPSTFESLFASSLIATSLGAGVFVSGAFGAGIALAGVGGAATLAAPATQRFFAGQTAVQQAGARFADSIGDVASKLARRYGINVPSSIAAVTGEGARQEMVFGEKARESIMSSSNAVKSQVYSGLLRNGRIDTVKEQDPVFFRELKAAYDRSIK